MICRIVRRGRAEAPGALHDRAGSKASFLLKSQSWAMVTREIRRHFTGDAPLFMTGLCNAKKSRRASAGQVIVSAVEF
jgi:hypothetical protein